MNRYVSRTLVIAPAVLLLLIGVSSVAFAWGQSNAPAPPMAPRPSPVSRAANPSGGGGAQAGAAVVVGTVQGKTASAITVVTTAHKSVTIDITSATRYSARGGAAATASSIAVGNVITAQGTYNSDGTFQATLVQLGQFSGGGFGRGRRGGLPGPGASASPSGVGL